MQVKWIAMSRKSNGLSILTLIVCAIGLPSPGICEDASLSVSAADVALKRSPKVATSSVHKFSMNGRGGVEEYSCRADSPHEVPAQRPDQIIVYGTVDADDLGTPTKSPMMQFREFLDARGKTRSPVFKESIGSDGSRSVKVTTSVRTYWIVETRGQIDPSGINQGKVATNCWGGCR